MKLEMEVLSWSMNYRGVDSVYRMPVLHLQIPVLEQNWAQQHALQNNTPTIFSPDSYRIYSINPSPESNLPPETSLPSGLRL